MDKGELKHDVVWLVKKKNLSESPVSLVQRKGFLSSPLELMNEMYPREKAVTPRYTWILDYSYTWLMF